MTPELVSYPSFGVFSCPDRRCWGRCCGALFWPVWNTGL